MSKETENHADEDIDCLEAIDNLYAYLDGELNNEVTLRKFRHHLDHCHSCYTRTELEGVISERIKASGTKKTPEALQKRLCKLLDDF